MTTQVERRASTRRRLIRSASELVASGGFVRASCEEIGARADMSRGAVNFHFGAKQHLLEAVIAENAWAWAESLRRAEQQAPPDVGPVQLLEILWHKWTGIPDSSRLLTMLLYETVGPSTHASNEVADINAACLHYIQRVLRRAQSNGQLPEGSDIDREAHLARAAILGLICQHATGSSDDTQHAYKGLRIALLDRWQPHRQQLRSTAAA